MIRPKLTRTVAPASLPVEVAKAKLHCRVWHNEQDAMIEGIIAAAVDYVERICNMSLITQTWRAYWPCFPDENCLVLPHGPVASVTHLKYTDSTNTQSTWASSNYVVDTQQQPARLWLSYGNIWPAAVLRPGLAIEVEYIAGYANEDLVPAAIKHAILMLVEHWYRNPSAVTVGNTAASVSAPLALAFDSLLAPYRIPAH